MALVFTFGLDVSDDGYSATQTGQITVNLNDLAELA